MIQGMNFEAMLETNGGEPWTTNGDPDNTRSDYNNHGYGGANNMASASYAQNLSGQSTSSPTFSASVGIGVAMGAGGSVKLTLDPVKPCATASFSFTAAIVNVTGSITGCSK